MIPKIFWFVYLYDEKSVMPLNINHYICVKSHLLNNPGSTAVVLTNNPEQFYEFPWMSKLMVDCKGKLNTKYQERLTDWHGNNIVSPMQESDILRFETLLNHGGVYCDLDMLSIRELPKEYWESEKVIQGIEPYKNFLAPRGLGSAFIMSPKRPQNPTYPYKHWLEVVLDGYKNYNEEIKKGLYELPIFRPYRLSLFHDDKVDVRQPEEFFPMYFYYQEVANFFLHRQFTEFPENTYEVHLWENRTKGLMKYLDEKYFTYGDQYYAQLGRKVLEGEIA